MSKGRQKHDDRQQALSRLGRSLVRRAGPACELCESSGVKLQPWEVPPFPEEPDLDAAVMICDRCRAGLEGGTLEGPEWRFLEGVVWSAVPAVQVCAVRLVRRIADAEVAWALDTSSGLFLDPEIEEWVRSS